jgi:hypothetical protein
MGQESWISDYNETSPKFCWVAEAGISEHKGFVLGLIWLGLVFEMGAMLPVLDSKSL